MHFHQTCAYIWSPILFSIKGFGIDGKSSTSSRLPSASSLQRYPQPVIWLHQTLILYNLSSCTNYVCVLIHSIHKSSLWSRALSKGGNVEEWMKWGICRAPPLCQSVSMGRRGAKGLKVTLPFIEVINPVIKDAETILLLCESTCKSLLPLCEAVNFKG